MTPEGLAEINGHTDVIRALRVWEHLQRQESHARLSSLGESEQEASSPTASTSGAPPSEDGQSAPPRDRYGSLGSTESRKGKERAFSISSNVSDSGSAAIKVKHSFEAFFRTRPSRAGSISSVLSPAASSPTSPMLAGLRISTKGDGSGAESEAPISPLAFSSGTSASPRYEGSFLNREQSGVSQSTLGLGQLFPDPPDRDSSSTNLATSPTRPSLAGLPHPSSTKTFGTSRRPSLPSILEMAAHPGTAIRQVFRRDHDDSPDSRISSDPHSPQSSTSPFSSSSRSPPHPSMFRGRRRSNVYNVSPNQKRHRRGYMSKHALLHLFRRGQSPPSRSPSPPQRNDSRPLLPEELDEGIEKLRRASLDLSMREDPDSVMPNSAPLHKSSFFSGELSLPTFSSLSVDPTLIPLPHSPSSSTLASFASEYSEQPSVVHEILTRSRKGSEVVAPSPLAREVVAQSSDSDTPSVRRSKSEMVKSKSTIILNEPDRPAMPSSPLRSFQSNKSGPSTSQPGTKPRSATLPTGFAKISTSQNRSASGSGRIMGLNWGEGMDLRKVASGILRRRSSRRQNPTSPTKMADDLREGRLKIRRVSEEKDTTAEGDQAETATIRAATAGEAHGKQSTESDQRTERGADADVEDDDDEYHDAEDASLFDYTEYSRYAEPLEMDLTTSSTFSDRSSTPVVVVQSPVDETGSATLEVIHSPDEELPQSALIPTPVAVPMEKTASTDTDPGTIDTERGVVEAERNNSEETERGEEPKSPLDELMPAAEAAKIPIPPSTSRTPPLAREPSPTPQAAPRKITPPRSRFVEIIAPEDISPVRRSHPARSWARFGRYRGASVGSGSGTTDSTRIVTPTSMRRSLTSAEDLPHQSPPHKRVQAIRASPPPQPPSVLSNIEGRARGKSVSSMSSSTSGMALSYGPSSTNSTSLTPPSTLSLGATFPPVPEHDVVHPVPRRKASTSAEAREIIKQAESDILQLAQMPDSLHSSRSLAAQLAAYGESHAMEEVFTERERYLGSEDGRSVTSDRDSYFSAVSEGASRGPSDVVSERSHRPSSLHSFGRRSTSTRMIIVGPLLTQISGFGAGSLLSVDGPHSASINTIYDKRAAAYRERLTALTSPPPLSSGASAHSSHRHRHRTRSPMASPNESWLNAGPSHAADLGVDDSVDQHPAISSPQPVATPSHRSGRKPSLPVGMVARQPSSKPSSMIGPSLLRSTHSLSPINSRVGSASFSGVTPLNFGISPSRFAGLSSPPMQSLGSVGAVAARSPSITSGFSTGGAGAGASTLSSGSPYISIFSNRFTGPHDGDDSDDEEGTPQQYTLIENDWMGGHVVDPDGLEKRKKWGQLKGAFAKPRKTA